MSPAALGPLGVRPSLSRLSRGSCAEVQRCWTTHLRLWNVFATTEIRGVLSLIDVDKKRGLRSVVSNEGVYLHVVLTNQN